MFCLHGGLFRFSVIQQSTESVNSHENLAELCLYKQYDAFHLGMIIHLTLKHIHIPLKINMLFHVFGGFSNE